MDIAEKTGKDASRVRPGEFFSVDSANDGREVMCRSRMGAILILGSLEGVIVADIFFCRVGTVDWLSVGAC